MPALVFANFPLKPVKFDSLEVCPYPDRASLGSAVAARVAESIRAACGTRGQARIVLAGAPSQIEFLDALVRYPIAWAQVTVFHTDEYVGLRADHPQSSRRFLHTHLLEVIPEPRAIHLMHAEMDPVHEAARYAKLLAEAPIDVACLDIGDNGRLAFNDPAVADFRDREIVKVVELDDEFRRQQVKDGCFPTIDAMPTHALTLTIPALVGARAVSCAAPGPQKALAMRKTLLGPVTTQCPASILRRHPHAVIHLDDASASLFNS